MGNDLTFRNDAREQLLKGIDAVADMVKVTLGPQGGLVALEPHMGIGAVRLTKDGVTIAKSISLSNNLQEGGANLARSVANKAVELSGDGTTTATILLQAIAKESNKMILAGMKPTNIKKGINIAVKTVIEELKTISKPVQTNEEISNVGTVSANGDREVGDKIAEAMEKVGKEGIITVEESKNFDFELEVVEGMRFDKGYINYHFCTNAEKQIVEFDNPYIMLLDKKIIDIKPLADICTAIMKEGRPLVIIAEDFEEIPLATLIRNKYQGFNVCAVKAPMFGNFMRDSLEDIAILTQGTVFKTELGIALEAMPVTMLGAAKKVIITRENTTIINGAGDHQIIKDRCDSLRYEIAEKNKTHIAYNVTVLEERLARLTGGVAVLKVGGATDVEMKERKDRVDDALLATKAAVEEGIIPGGGVALFYAGKKLLATGYNDEIIAGINIIKRALEAPLRQIITNAGMGDEIVINELSKNYKEDGQFNNYGFDANNMMYVDMLEAGIIDPTKVVRSALESAASVALNVINTQGLVTEDKATRLDLIRQALQGK
jgi:chaperonin GroEL